MNLKFYGDLVYKFKTIIGRTDFSDQFRKIKIHHKRIGYDLNVIRQSACLVISPITLENVSALFNCTPVDRASDSMMTLRQSACLVISPITLENVSALFNCTPVDRASDSMMTGAIVFCLVHRAQLMIFFCLRFSVVLFGRLGISICHTTHCIC